jgi:lysophospholipase L1-like esterase
MVESMWRRRSTRAFAGSIPATGVMKVIAGTGTAGFSGDGGPATEAQLAGPSSLAFVGEALYVADNVNRRVRRIDADGTISTVAGGGSKDVTPGVYDGAPLAARLGGPFALAINGLGGVLIADSMAEVLRLGAGKLKTIYGGGCGGLRCSPQVDQPAAGGRAYSPDAVAVGPNGDVYVAEDAPIERVFRIDKDGILRAFAGSGADCSSCLDVSQFPTGLAVNAPFWHPRGLVADRTGNVLVTSNNVVRSIGLDGRIALVAGGGFREPPLGIALQAPGALSITADGDLLFTDGILQRVYRIRGAATGPVASPAGRSIVALGDSVSAGEGIGYGWTFGFGSWNRPDAGDGVWVTDTVGAGCHQTEPAHPRVLATLLGGRVLPLSCTGSSVINGVLGDRVGDVSSPAQLGSATLFGAAAPNRAYDEAEPDLVTLSVGANDIDFATEVKDCYTPFARCGSDVPLSTKLAALKVNLRSLLGEIRYRGQIDGKVPIVALTQYVDPYPATFPKGQHCLEVNPGDLGNLRYLGVGLDSGEFDYLRSGLFDLNATLSAVAAEFQNVVVVKAPTAFERQDFCSNDPWVFGPSIQYPYLARPDNKAPFHPTAAGQRAIAEAVEAAVAARFAVPAGSDVVVQLPDDDDLRIRLDQVVHAGSLAIRNVPTASAPPTPDFNAERVMEITNSADFTGSAHLSVPAESDQRLYHYTSGAWQQVPSLYSAGRLHADVTSFSPFALAKPVARVHAVLAAPAGERVVSLDAAGSTGPVISYEWDFGDGAVATTTTGTITHTFASAGHYAVTVTVRSEAGANDQAQRTVTVTNLPPVAVLDGPDTVTTGAVATFDSSRSTDVASTVWDFHDGDALLGGAVATHRWAKPGTYAVTVTVIDDENTPATATRTVTVSDPLVATQTPEPADPPPAPIPLAHPLLTTRASLLTGKLVLRSGRAVVRLRCLDLCAGTIALELRGKTVAKASFRAKKTGTLSVTLPRSRRLKSGASVRVRVEARAPGREVVHFTATRRLR